MARHRLIVGVDYGTTYSGISYVTTDKKDLDDINVVRSWPGKDGEWKAPTRIAYASENDHLSEPLKRNMWGYKAEAPMRMCSWTKLLLDGSARPAQSDDQGLQAAIEGGKFRLPPDRNAQGVVADYLSELYKHMETKLVKELGRSVFDSTPMDVWLTVPAVWTDAAQSATKAAAVEAGFGTRPNDTISIISEPEAAAVAVLKNIARPEALNKPQPGDNILICDCGGGTVDITSYTVSQLEPTPGFEEICVGIGAKCGSTSIDRALHELMRARFGSNWDRIEDRRKGPGSNFMEKWERVKRQFGDPGDDRVQELQLNIRGAKDSSWYDDDEGMVRLTKADVKQVFEPTVREVIKLVSQQNESIKAAGKKLNRLVLVGGFGESPYLFSRLREWCRSNGNIQPYCPEYPQAAIVRGAALRGLIGIAPRTKRCRRHYGCKVGMPFRKYIDSESDAYYDKVDNEKMCRNRMKWIIDKGAEVNEDTRRSHSLILGTRAKDADQSTTLSLYSSTAEEPPDRYDDSGNMDLVGTIAVDFNNCTLTGLKKHREHTFWGSKFQQIPFEVQVEFGAKSGLLGVRALYQGTVTGSADLVFE